MRELQTSPYIYVEYSMDDQKRYVNDILNQKKIEISDDDLSLLKKFRYPIDEDTAVEMVTEAKLDKLKKNSIILYVDEMWSKHNYQSAEIETGTVCNWSCEYCPVSFNKRKSEVMSMEDFRQILKKLKSLETIQVITINAYNEPAIDPYFIDRIEALKEFGFELILHTNGSALTDSMIKTLEKSNIVRNVCFNLPHLDKEKFEKITGSKTYARTIENIDKVINEGLDVEFSIQSCGGDTENINEMNKRYGDRISRDIKVWPTVDRAGLLENEYSQGIRVEGNLKGCRRIIKNVSISVNGDVYICSHDFHKKNVLGNILNDDLDTALSSEQAQTIKMKTFGYISAEEDFICRKCMEMDIFCTYSRLSRSFRPVCRY